VRPARSGRGCDPARRRIKGALHDAELEDVVGAVTGGQEPFPARGAIADYAPERRVVSLAVVEVTRS